MRWSYADLMETPAPVVDEVVAWMVDEAEAHKKQQADSARERERARLRR